MTERSTATRGLERNTEGDTSVFELRALSLLRETDQSFPLGDANYVIVTRWRKPPRPFSNALPVNCECGSPLLKVGTHCNVCHASFVEDQAYELHMVRGHEAPELSDAYTFTEWGGYRLSTELPDGKAWMLNGEMVDAELLPWVADYVQPIPEVVESHN